MGTRYYDIEDGTCLLVEQKYGIDYRLLRNNGTWIDGFSLAVRYVMQGKEVMWDEITEKQAEALAAKLHGSISDAFFGEPVSSPELARREKLLAQARELWKNVAIPEGMAGIK